MAADLTNPFGPSCCDGGICGLDDNSAMPCGCDKGIGWTCERHREDVMRDTVPAFDVETVELVGVTRLREFIVKDSGKREQYAGGMVRDTTEGKLNYALIADGPMFKRWAEHLTKGAIKYGEGNWLKAEGDVELRRARQSAFRHFMQWYFGEIDEDHASAVYFNINECEYIKQKMRK